MTFTTSVKGLCPAICYPFKKLKLFFFGINQTLALEIIPRNSPSLLYVVASDIHNFAIAHNMRLNPTKCKEMHINFLRNSNCLINPIIIGGNVIKRANSCKILGFPEVELS